MQREVLVDTAEASHEVILERADGPFSCVATMVAGRDQLEVDLLVVHLGLENLRGFIVEATEPRCQSSFDQALMDEPVPAEDRRSGTGGDGLDEVRVAIKMIEDNEVIVPLA